jgi:2-(1,2-epoxy-1,2-dihydrophenyl)acetyl-CoA isomerase
MSLILIEQTNGVMNITLNNPDKLNSFNRAMALQLQEALDDASYSDDVRCVVIKGSGRAFCAGQDLAEAIDEENNLSIKRIVSEHYNPIIKKITDLQKPVIAAVNGVAAGAGANIALACDIVIAAESAKFIQAFSAIGLVPDSGGTYFLPRLVGSARAAALMMTGDRVNAEEAVAMGMIYRSIPNEEFESEIEKLSTKLSGMPTQALALTKKLLQKTWTSDLSKQLRLEEEYQDISGSSHDYNEGVQAFLQKRKPEFKGK